ncbi:hypothetical protein GCM10010862_18130 [Devosia nitrariae]|uniref:Uncharacterized protein n=1 Tax=Devosia nitrariae TaxID=2071872 RepID=A0ABQ5W429_9HYPH|nr:hypothetical protein GCM10010862_18130 [Devosia nitrariae]
MQAVGIVGAIGEDLARCQASDELASRCHVVLLAGSDLEADRQAERVYDSMDLGAEAAA